MLGNTGEIIDCEFQKTRIAQYARDNGIEIVQWFEDETYNEHLFARPGLRDVVAYTKPYEYVLVERIWALSRKWLEVKAFIKVMETRKVRLEAATTLWDCVSQMARAQYRKPEAVAAGVPPCAMVPGPAEATSINLVERFGRFSQVRRGRAIRSARSKIYEIRVRRPRKLALGKLHFRTA
jgi:hypothetical protein